MFSFVLYLQNSLHPEYFACLLGLYQAYLAYGVPENDIKLFSLMQKV